MLSYPLIDLDSHIEKTAGMTISEIFNYGGEMAFRKMESQALAGILAGKTGSGDAVLSLGGGTVTTAECAEMIKSKTFCIYLKAGTDTLVRNLREDFASRPMLSGNGCCPEDEESLRVRIEELMAAREPLYEAAAAAVVMTDRKSFRDVAEEIAGLVGSGVAEKGRK